jgi:hypothetical protein
MQYWYLETIKMMTKRRDTGSPRWCLDVSVTLLRYIIKIYGTVPKSWVADPERILIHWAAGSGQGSIFRIQVRGIKMFSNFEKLWANSASEQTS